MTFELDPDRLMLVVESVWDILWLCAGVVTLGAAVLGTCYLIGYYGVRLIFKTYDMLRSK